MTKLEQMLAEIEARVKAATPGPWVAMPAVGDWGTPSIEKKVGGVLARMTHYYPMREDAELIAHAPTDLTKLLAALRLAIARADGAISANYLGMNKEYLGVQAIEGFHAELAEVLRG